MSYGDSLCSSEEQNGWTPESSPGPLASEGQAAQQSAASAAQASAAASASSQAASDDAQVRADTAGLNSAYAAWSADVASAQAALRRVQGEPLCSGGTTDQQTYDDAQNVYDDGQQVYDDEQAMSQDASSEQSDAGNLPGSRYASDVAAANAAAGKAQQAVSADESDKVQQAVVAVQDAADSMCP
jgi:hypothetical protein